MEKLETRAVIKCFCNKGMPPKEIHGDFMLWRLFITALWSPAGKQLTSWLLFVMYNFDFVTFPCGILGQVWHLIALIPDLCRLSYLDKKHNSETEVGLNPAKSNPSSIDMHN